MTAGIITGAQGTVHYSWKNSLGTVVGTTATVTGLGTGTYTLAVSDNCSILTCSQTITQPTAMTMGACTHTNLSCNSSCGGNNTGSVTAGIITGAQGTVHYSWKNSLGRVVGTSATVTGLGTGTYTLTVSDNCSTLTCSQIITQPTAMTMGACTHTNISFTCSSGNGGTCNGSCYGINLFGNGSCGKTNTGSVTAGPISGAQGTVHYVWKNSSGAIVGTTATVSGLSSGTYTLTVTDNCNTFTCSQTITITECTPFSYCHKSLGISMCDTSNELKEVSSFSVKLFPNPFNDHLTINIISEDRSAVSIKIYDLNGKLISELSDVIPSEEINIGSELPASSYFVEITRGRDFKAFSIRKL